MNEHNPESKQFRISRRGLLGIGGLAAAAATYAVIRERDPSPETTFPEGIYTPEAKPTPTEAPDFCAIAGLENLYENDTACVIEPQSTPPNN